jgi:hypothetical protein
MIRLIPVMNRLCAMSAAVAAMIVSTAGAQTAPATAPARPPVTAPKAPPASTNPAGSAPASTPAKDLPKAEDIVKAAMDAMGGKKAFEDIKSTSIKASMKMPMGDMGLDLKSATNGGFVVRQSLGGNEMAMGSDGKIGWKNNPMVGYQLMSDEELGQARRQSNMYNMVFNVQDDFKELQTVDKVQFNNVDCYKVKMVPKDESEPEQTGYFAVESKLPQGAEISAKQPGQMPATLTYSEWKDLDKMHVFTKIDIEQAGFQMSMNFTEVQFNKVDPAAFDLPNEVKELASKKNEEPAASQPAGAPKPAPPPATRPATGPGKPGG